MSDRVDKGARTLAKVLLGAALVGLLVLIFHPDYRAAAAAMWRGEPETSPIWHSNRGYYPMNTLERDEGGAE